MSRRINVVLPDEVASVPDRLAPKGRRSRLIADAISRYVLAHPKMNLAERLKQGAIANAERDLDIAQEWL